MTLDLNSIKEARERIASYIVETPLLRLKNLDERLGCEVYIKPECLQTTGAFKLRGAMNKMLMLSPEELARGIVAASSGNHGRAIAYGARLLGTKATIVMPFSASQLKVDAIKDLGAEVVQCETSERFEVTERLCKERGATMVPPFNDEDVMSGQGTAGLEIIAQNPDLNAVIVPVSGGGLIGGVATAIKELCPSVKVFGAEPVLLPRYSMSLVAGQPTKVPQNKTVADALVAQIPGEVCFPYVQKYVDQIYDVDEDYILKAQKLLLMEGKILCEPSSAIGIGAILQGLIKFLPEDKVCFLISGGNLAFSQLSLLDQVEY